MIKLLLPGRGPREVASEALRGAVQAGRRYLAEQEIKWRVNIPTAVQMETLIDAAETLMVRELGPKQPIEVEQRGGATLPPPAVELEPGDVVQIAPEVDAWGNRFGSVIALGIRNGRGTVKLEIPKNHRQVQAVEVDQAQVRRVGRAQWLPRKVAIKAVQ
jgi:hypothetical protein